MTSKTTHFTAGLVGAVVAFLIIIASGKLNEPEMHLDGVVGKPDVAFLMAKEREFSAMSVAEGPKAAWAAFMADDAVVISDGGPMTVGNANIVAGFDNWPDGAQIVWAPEAADMASSGDFGYTWGIWVSTRTGADGEIKSSTGRYFSIWKLQPDGSWKVSLDMGNDLPADTSADTPADKTE